MKLSILDQAPVSKGSNARGALADAVKLAQAGEKFGYERFWLAEHHSMLAFASSTPEITLAAIGSETSKIRIGSGATLIPYYSPYKVAENYHTLATLFPERVDLGVGRAPGGPAEATEALNKEYLKNVYANQERVSELMGYIHHDNHAEKIKMSPLADPPPEVWMLGTSVKSAKLAGELGMNYCFGYFMSNAGDMKEVIDTYRNSFKPAVEGQTPQVMITVTAFVAETKEKAKDVAMSTLIWGIEKERSFGQSDTDDGIPSIKDAKNFELTEEEQENVDRRLKSMFVGTGEEVAGRLKQLAEAYSIEEIMISTNTYSIEDKLKSFELLKEAME
ncbi:LLM class flavin-dependent oxidoreductase [Lacicoccus qingdaonensis]|uniref:Luciferase family oxidoreductase, group 1 n=1 Tax=Lacicoccus qingdaonensis TaxID=576118 RepID=A0A1G9IR42_9BACL|nr:LLM class flavin-dependent oxidoreductase [Salinicoccus qingdaonensis]SDL27591.1 luciferase family oxidoreductase, group 1 [Salinicoccus qingdaonensis]